MNPRTAERTTRANLFLTPADEGRALTLEEFLSADGEEGYRYELIHGRLVVMPTPNLPHERLVGLLKKRLFAYAELHPDRFNEVMGPARIILETPDDVSAPEPDLVAYRDFPLNSDFDEANWIDLTPVLAIEIISKDMASKDTDRNPDLYLGGANTSGILDCRSA